MSPKPKPRNALEELCGLLAEAGLRVTYDANRDVTKPCVFCRAKDVRLVELGRYLSGDPFTRPVCALCAEWAASLARRQWPCDA